GSSPNVGLLQHVLRSNDRRAFAINRDQPLGDHVAGTRDLLAPEIRDLAGSDQPIGAKINLLDLFHSDAQALERLCVGLGLSLCLRQRNYAPYGVTDDARK